VTVIEKVKGDLVERLEELRPYLEEARDIERALAALNGSNGAPAKPRAKRAKGPSSPLTTGGRAEQAIRLVTEQPGLTVAQLSGLMEIGPHLSLPRDARARTRGQGPQSWQGVRPRGVMRCRPPVTGSAFTAHRET
jgi:hypothetical protein